MRKLSHKFEFCAVGGGTAGLCEPRHKKAERFGAGNSQTHQKQASRERDEIAGVGHPGIRGRMLRKQQMLLPCLSPSQRKEPDIIH